MALGFRIFVLLSLVALGFYPGVEGDRARRSAIIDSRQLRCGRRRVASSV